MSRLFNELNEATETSRDSMLVLFARSKSHSGNVKIIDVTKVCHIHMSQILVLTITKRALILALTMLAFGSRS